MNFEIKRSLANFYIIKKIYLLFKHMFKNNAMSKLLKLLIKNCDLLIVKVLH